MIINQVIRGGGEGATLVITLSDSRSGVTISASNGTDTFTGTSSAQGTATIAVKPGYDYTITANKYESASQHVDVGTYNVTLTFIPPLYWGIQIDESVSDCYDMVSYPATLSTGSGTYTNCIPTNATPMSGADSLTLGSFASGNPAKLIEGIKPVSFDGTNWADLNKTDETPWPSTQGTDCFTEFPFRWLSITKSGDVITVVFSDNDTAPDSTFQNWAFLGADGTTQRPNFHLGCYTASGTVSSRKITSGVYSQKGSSNAVNAYFNQFWVGASARGSEYDCLPFAMWTYLQALFLVLYKSTDSQTAHSKGYVGGSAVQDNTAFTYSNDYGMYGTTADTKTQMAFFWLHNLWGNLYQFIASVFTRAGSSREIYYILGAMSRSSNWDNSSWNSTSNYAKMASLGTSSGSTGRSSSGYFTKACGSNGAGFIASSDAGSGSSTTYYPDFGNVNVYSSRASFPAVGGNYNYRDSAGIFYAVVDSYSTSSGLNYGSRLAYRGGHNYS